MKRLRLLRVHVQPEVVVDDGDSLIPFPIQPFSLSPADWPRVVEDFADAFSKMQAQVEAQDQLQVEVNVAELPPNGRPPVKARRARVPAPK